MISLHKSFRTKYNKVPNKCHTETKVSKWKQKCLLKWMIYHALLWLHPIDFLEVLNWMKVEVLKGSWCLKLLLHTISTVMEYQPLLKFLSFCILRKNKLSILPAKSRLEGGPVFDVYVWKTLTEDGREAPSGLIPLLRCAANAFTYLLLENMTTNSKVARLIKYIC